MTPDEKFEAFSAELFALCRKYDVHLAPSMYDHIELHEGASWTQPDERGVHGGLINMLQESGALTHPTI